MPGMNVKAPLIAGLAIVRVIPTKFVKCVAAFIYGFLYFLRAA
jgi:hypothetical protein